MAYNISLNSNYIYIDDDGGTLFDRPTKEVTISKVNLDSIEYNVRLNDKAVSGLCSIPWTSFTLDGVPFASQQAFEDWKNENTGTGASSGGGSGPVDPAIGLIQSLRATTDGNVSSGAKVVSLVFRGNDGTLNGSLVPNGYAKEFFYPNGEDLPQIDYTVPTSGGGGAALRGVYIDISL